MKNGIPVQKYYFLLDWKDNNMTYHKTQWGYGDRLPVVSVAWCDDEYSPAKPYQVMVAGVKSSGSKTKQGQINAEQILVQDHFGILKTLKDIIPDPHNPPPAPKKSDMDIFWGELKQAITDKNSKPDFSLSENLSLHFGSERIRLFHGKGAKAAVFEVAYWGKMTKKSKVREWLIGRRLVSK